MFESMFEATSVRDSGVLVRGVGAPNRALSRGKSVCPIGVVVGRMAWAVPFSPL